MKVNLVRLIARQINDQIYLITILYNKHAIKANASIIMPIGKPKIIKV